MFLSYFLAFFRAISAPTDGDQLRRYIESQNPLDITDVERLAINWQRGATRGVWL